MKKEKWIEKLSGVPDCLKGEPKTKKETWEKEFDKRWEDPMTRKYGKHFVLYCSFCSGEWRQEIKDFIRSEIKKAKKEAIREYLKSEEGKVYQDYQELKKMAQKEILDSLEIFIVKGKTSKEGISYQSGWLDCLSEIKKLL